MYPTGYGRDWCVALISFTDASVCRGRFSRLAVQNYNILKAKSIAGNYAVFGLS